MASGNDMKMAESTYGSFINMVKWGGSAVVIVALIVIALIA